MERLYGVVKYVCPIVPPNTMACSCDIDTDGEISMIYFAPRIKTKELDAFLNRDLTISYLNKRNRSTIIVDGPIRAEVIVDETLYSGIDKRMEIYYSKSEVPIHLCIIDTYTMKILGYRILLLKGRCKHYFDKMLSDDRYFSEKSSFINELYKNDFKTNKKRATYIGKLYESDEYKGVLID